MTNSPKPKAMTISKSTSESALEIFRIWDVPAAFVTDRDV
jgi:hypothetical protein